MLGFFVLFISRRASTWVALTDSGCTHSSPSSSDLRTATLSHTHRQNCIIIVKLITLRYIFTQKVQRIVRKTRPWMDGGLNLGVFLSVFQCVAVCAFVDEDVTLMEYILHCGWAWNGISWYSLFFLLFLGLCD